MCLSSDLVLNKAVPKDRKICLEDVTIPANRIDIKLYNDSIAAGH